MSDVTLQQKPRKNPMKIMGKVIIADIIRYDRVDRRQVR